MSCLAAESAFRLLDRTVGWDAAVVEGLTGLDAAEGLQLSGDGTALREADIAPFIPPPVLAPGCGRCDWFLATPPWPEARLLALDGCSNRWRPAWDADCVPTAITEIVAVAFDRDLIALADRDRVLVLEAQSLRIVGEAALPAPVDLSFGPQDTLVVACEAGRRIEVLAPSGRPLGYWPAPLPEGRVERLAHDREGRLWLVMRQDDGTLALHRQDGLRGAFVEETPAGLAAAFTRTALVGHGIAGFTLSRGEDGAPVSWDWAGRLLAGGAAGGAGHVPPDRFARQGQLLTLAIDSGVERCRWHRIRVDAEVPPRTAIEISLATNDRPDPAPQGLAVAPWTSFAAGLPHPADWQTIEPQAADAMIRQPAGRYLFVRLRLSGDGQATPQVRRLHLDLPRATSADLLPAVYRQEPKSADFTERFLALFDSGLETIDASVARLPAALDAGGTDPELLPWLAAMLGIGFDPAWDAATRRRLLAGAPELFRRRGTPAGLRLALELIADNGRSGAGALIDEHGLGRAWGAVSGAGSDPRTAARLGATRLFSRAAARMRLGSSAIGKTPLLSVGNPDDDPHETGAFRFSVELPADVPLSIESLRALVESQKPAHTLAAVRTGGSQGNFVLSGLGRLGIDTLTRRPEPSVLGRQPVRLGSNAVLGGRAARSLVLAGGGPHPPSAGSMCE